MDTLQVIMIMSSTAMCLISGLLLVVHSILSKLCTKWWFFSAALQTVICVATLLINPLSIEISIQIAFFSLQLLVCQSLTIGTLIFIDKSISVRYRLAILSLVTLITAVLLLFGHELLAITLFVSYITVILVEVAYTLYLLEKKTIDLKVATIVFILNGLHWLGFPLMGKVDWFVPIGCMINMLLTISIFLLLSVMALMQFKTHILASKEQAIRAALSDPLTGLYNRSHLDTLFKEYAEEAEKIQRSFILLYIDLDNFKYVNDTYGHAAGDIVLITITKRMRHWLGHKGDALRIGGDELIVLTRLRGDFSQENAFTAARKLLDLIEQPIVDGPNTFFISASVGGCCYGIPHKDCDNMVSDADKWMYSAKRAGGHRIYFSQSSFEKT